MAGILGRWGDGSEKTLALDVIEMLSRHADQTLGGLSVWLEIRSYPAVLFVTGYGLGLVRSRRWSDLHDLLAAPIQKRNDRGIERTVEKLFLGCWPGGNNDYWKNLDGFERRKTALSDHLCGLFQNWSNSFVGASLDVERLYENWEILSSLAYLEAAGIGDIDAALAQGSSNGWVWFPIGRSAWHEDMREQILESLLSDPTKSELLEAGFAKRDQNFLSKSVSNYRRLAGRMRW
ncbi:hypothetical protein [Rhizobium laguerreae]|nr:hypothetical protein [Rhizobium laguerreae]